MMDHSSSSSRDKKSEEIIINDDDGEEEEEDEESGWTSYFQDYFSSRSIEEEEEHNNKNSYCSNFDGGSSLLSDAASSAAVAWNNKRLSQQHHHHHHHHDYYSSYSRATVVVDASPNLPKKLCFKKSITRTKQISQDHDDSLEDTASSPLNSPKVGDLTNSTEIIDGSTSMGKELISSSEHNLDLKRHDDNNEELNLNNKSIDECTTDLKKRGLCLVPFSMLVNYFG
ncbi:hypothetical protein PIB30_001663 [Stylosanthes scabra]|uniref:Uncharacterized protein n=1 Tax=Stylosanthes scabra TaxID=79078 RepID=A0ABU6T2F9_9FABA|nr:hypothetical protein [Stylosanthes scabra]